MKQSEISLELFFTIFANLPPGAARTPPPALPRYASGLSKWYNERALSRYLSFWFDTTQFHFH